MKNKYCPICRSVYSGAKDFCCGKLSEDFDLHKHGEYLIGPANSWIRVYKKWENHPLFEKIADDCNMHNCASAPTIMNEFIKYLIDNQKEVKE